MTAKTFFLDDDDLWAANAAIAHHQATHRVAGEHILPEGESDLPGAILGEICRDWLEAHGFDINRRGL